MLISISGKIGSGKDTVGTIVQYLVHTKGIVNLEYFEEFSNNSAFNRENFSKWQIKKFADKLKDIACMMLGCTRAQLEDQEFKKTVLGPEWNNMTVREFLQKLGTDAMRDNLHENVWVNSLMSDYVPKQDKSYEEILKEQLVYGSSKVTVAFPNWIITDTRFPNELQAVKQREGITIRVTRIHPGLLGEVEKGNVLHPSETALDDAKFDYEIVNDGTIEDLIEKVRVVLIELNII